MLPGCPLTQYLGLEPQISVSLVAIILSTEESLKDHACFIYSEFFILFYARLVPLSFYNSPDTGVFIEFRLLPYNSLITGL